MTTDILDHLYYLLRDTHTDLSHGETEIALENLEQALHFIKAAQVERANLEAQMADFYDSSSVLDDEEVPNEN